MKRKFLFVFIVLYLISLNLYAETFLSITAGVSNIKQYSLITSETDYWSANIGMTAGHFFSDKIGVNLSFDVLFPLEATIREDTHTSTIKIDNFPCFLSLFLGPSFCFIRDDPITFFVPLGFHMMTGENPSSDIFWFVAGIGLEPCLVLDLWTKFSLTFSAGLFWDSLYKTDFTSSFKNFTGFMFIPKIGLEYKF